MIFLFFRYGTPDGYTLPYWSLDSHRHAAARHRTDVESWFYVLIELYVRNFFVKVLNVPWPVGEDYCVTRSYPVNYPRTNNYVWVIQSIARSTSTCTLRPVAHAPLQARSWITSVGKIDQGGWCWIRKGPILERFACFLFLRLYFPLSTESRCFKIMPDLTIQYSTTRSLVHSTVMSAVGPLRFQNPGSDFPFRSTKRSIPRLIGSRLDWKG